LSEDGREQASMGIAVGDFNRDGKVDFYVTAFSDDYNTLYTNDGDGISPTRRFPQVSPIPQFHFWVGVRLALDFDNDGLTDLFVCNGHVYPAVDQQDWGTTWLQRPQLFEISMERDLRKSHRLPEADWQSYWRDEAPPWVIFSTTAIWMLSSTTWTPVPRCCETW